MKPIATSTSAISLSLGINLTATEELSPFFLATLHQIRRLFRSRICDTTKQYVTG